MRGRERSEDKSFFFSSRRRHTRWPRDWSSDGALPICLPSLLPLFALPFLAQPLLPGSLRAAEKIEFPAASQHGVVKQRVGLTDVEVDYSRPNKNEIGRAACRGRDKDAVGPVA